MLDIFGWLFLILAIVSLVPVVVLLIQVLASLTQPRPVPTPTFADAFPGRITVLIPAHNESSGLLPTLHTVLTQLGPQDRCLVVADNCSDDTANQARAAGVEVIERHDSVHRGKGFALDFGLQHIRSHPPEVVVIVDADCLLSSGSLYQLAHRCIQQQRPVQAYYPMLPPESPSLKMRVAAFAWQVKNFTRPLGMFALQLPCQLMGTGMAFPWPLLAHANLANGDLVEDMKLGIDLARTGHPPIFCPSACVTSYFPSTVQGAQSQRTRWEHGHLQTIFKEVPRLLWQSLRERNLSLMAMALDLAVPPLALLTLMVLLTLGGSAAVMYFGGPSTAWWLSLLIFGLLTVCVGFAWWQVGRTYLTFLDLLKIPIYVLWKIPLYFKYLARKQVEWVRSQRDR
jgi:cellulose synthase/poly-beta-1,6-N-acetylglucosamine synthase-like glycosyltransferase